MPAIPGINVLLVEDEIIIAMLVERQLSQLGCRVIGRVTTGENAVQFVRETKPDLIFMDIKLAGPMSGIDAYRQIREFTFVPVVFMTAYGTPQIRADVTACSPLDFLEKPLPQQRLQDALRHYKANFGEPISLD
jgi:CheY-like chemotaxis protein